MILDYIEMDLEIEIKKIFRFNFIKNEKSKIFYRIFIY